MRLRRFVPAVFALAALAGCATPAGPAPEAPSGGVQVPATRPSSNAASSSGASSSTSSASVTRTQEGIPSASVISAVDEKAIADPAKAFVIAYHSIDTSLPYPGWRAADFAGMLGGSLAQRQVQRDAAVKSPSAGDLAYWDQMKADRFRQVVIVDKVRVVPQQSGAWLVEVSWRLSVTRKSDPAARSGASQFTVVTVMSDTGRYVAVSDSMPQAP